MVLIIKSQDMYNALFKTEEEREAHKEDKWWFCDKDNKKLIQGFLKNAGEEALKEIASQTFVSWKDFTEATNDMKPLPGVFFIKEIR